MYFIRVIRVPFSFSNNNNMSKKNNQKKALKKAFNSLLKDFDCLYKHLAKAASKFSF